MNTALLVGHSPDSFGLDCVGRTSVTRGTDFRHGGLRYQVKANRPSGKRGSFVTLVARAKNYDWDRLLWLLYDRGFQLLEAWEWTVDDYRAAHGALSRLSPADMRRGRRVYPSRGHTLSLPPGRLGRRPRGPPQPAGPEGAPRRVCRSRARPREHSSR